MVSISDFTTGPSTKVFIIELCRRFHIISGGNIFEYKIGDDVITEYSNDALNNFRLSYGGTNHKYNTNYVVKIKPNGNGYFIYNIEGNKTGTYRGFKAIEYDESQDEFNLLQHISEEPSSNVWLNNFSGALGLLTEMAISPSGEKIALAGGSNIYFFDIDEDGKIVTSSEESFTYCSGCDFERVGGMEFVSNNKLIYSVFYFNETYPYSSDKVEVIDISISPFTSTHISGSEDYARSQIEIGKDGKVYVASSGGVYWIDWDKATPTIESASLSFSPLFNVDVYDDLNNDGYDFKVFAFPGQVIGQLGDQNPSNILGKTIITNTQTHGFTTSQEYKQFLTDDEDNLEVWVVDSLIIKDQGHLVLNHMTMHFDSNAPIIIEKGGKLTKSGTTITGWECDMWPGIIVDASIGGASGRAEFITHALHGWSEISDAVVALELKNTQHDTSDACAVTLNRVNFYRNAQGLVSNNMNMRKVKFSNANFFGSEELLNNDYGFTYFEANEGWHTITKNHVEANGCWNFNVGANGHASNENMDFGDMPNSYYPIRFVGAQASIEIKRSSMDVQYAEFTDFRRIAIDADAQIQNIHNLKVYHSYIHDGAVFQDADGGSMGRGIRAINGFKLIDIGTDRRCYFKNLYAYGVEIRNNKGAEIKIGGHAGSTFENVNWAAIHLQGNGSYYKSSTNEDIGTKIQIYSNWIKSHPYAKGISIIEPFSNGNRNFVRCLIGLNFIEDVTRGIELVNVTGNNGSRPLNARPDLSANEQRFFTQITRNFTLFNTIRLIPWGIDGQIRNFGVRMQNCLGFDLRNGIARVGGVGGVLPQSKGIIMHNSPNTFLSGNTVNSMEIGINLSDNMLNSNYTCNNISGVRYGYRLQNHVLRDRDMDSNFVVQGYQEIEPGVFIPITGVHGWDGLYNNIDKRPVLEGDREDNFGSLSLKYDVVNCDMVHNKWSFNESTYNNRNSFFYHRIEYSNPINNYWDGIIYTFADPRCSFDDDDLSDTISNHDVSSSFAFNSSNPVQDWNVKYYVNRLYEQGLSDTFYSNSEIITVSYIEDLIAKEDFDSAIIVINSFSPSSIIAQDFKTVSEIWVNTRLQDSFEVIDTLSFLVYTHPIDSAGIETLITIAEKNYLEESPYAINARTLLWMEKQILVDEPEYTERTYPQIFGTLDTSCANNPLMENWSVHIQSIDSDELFMSNIVDDEGNFSFPGRQLFQTVDTSAGHFFRIVAISPNSIDTAYSEFATLEDFDAMENMVLKFDPECILPINYPDIEGDIDTTCSEPGIWNVYFETEYGLNTGFSTMSDLNGYFIFNGNDVFTQMDTSHYTLYKIAAVSPNESDTLYSGLTFLGDFASLVTTLTCNEPPSLSVTNKTNLDENRIAFCSLQDNTLHLWVSQRNTQFKLYSLSGVELVYGSVDDKKTIDMSRYASGLYLVRFYDETNGWHKVQKVIKN